MRHPHVEPAFCKLVASLICSRLHTEEAPRRAHLTSLNERLRALSAQQIQGMRRGIEKESLRALPTGALALTPHPAALGSALPAQLP